MDGVELAPMVGAFFEKNLTNLASIQKISITMTLDDGDTASGNFDFNDLFLSLDGIATGIALNGFANNQELTLTIMGVPTNAGAIHNALTTDGLLVATFTDDDPGDNVLPGIGTVNTTLSITVPEPGTLAIFGLGLAGLGFARRKRMI